MASTGNDEFAALTAKRLEGLRKELVNIGLRGNPLVNLRPTSASALELFGADQDDIFERLVNGEEKIRVRPRRGRDQSDQDELGLLSSSPSDPPRATPVEEEPVVGGDLLADLDGETMVARLNKIRRGARLNREELGFDVLFLAMGFLSYRDSPAAESSRLAPLLLVPVTLTQTPAGRRYHVSFNGEDIGTNIALSELLKERIGVELPEVDEESVPSEVFDKVGAAIEDLEGYTVLPYRTYLGLFSSAYTHMHRDLDPAVWPLDSQPSKNEILQGLLGGRHLEYDDFDIADWAIGVHDVDLPGHLEPTVLDADASQLDAIHKVESGQSLVIQGPPGTGKSQTITNIIAHAVKDGKRVLFVAEKMAALEVVKRRLDEIQLGHLALELHGTKSRKQDVLDQLRDTDPEAMNFAEPTESEVKELERAEHRLSAYSDAVNRELPIVGRTIVNAAAALEAMRGRSLPKVDLPGIALATDAKFEEDLQLAREFTDHVELMAEVLGDYSGHPFNAVAETSVTRESYDEARDALRQALRLIGKVSETAMTISTTLGLDPARDVATIRSQIPWARRALQAPDPGGIRPHADCWKNAVDQLHEVAQVGRDHQRISMEFADEIRPKTWARDLSRHLEIWETRARSFFRLLNRDFREARNDLRRWFHHAATDNVRHCRALISAVMERQDLEHRFQVLEPVAASAFADHWQGWNSDWDRLDSLIEWAAGVRADVERGRLPRAALGWTTQGSQLPFTSLDLDELEENLNSLEANIEAYAGLVWRPLIEFSDSTPIWNGDNSLKHCVETLVKLEYHELGRFMRYHGYVNDLRRSIFGEVIEFILEHESDFDLIRDTLTACRLEAIVGRAREDTLEIRDFNVSAHERARQRFAEIDRKLHATARVRARAFNSDGDDANSYSSGHHGQERILRKEFEKRRRHMATRALIIRACEAIQIRKPVFMMSPASVAKFLKPGVAKFDLVVFDEASQMRAADAVGAILRGDQVVVVGDDQQLPPSDFFVNLLSGDEDDEDDVDDGMNATGIESILGLFKIAETPSAHLTWHYRSRREDLIDFSNRNFYENGLVTFPGPFHGQPERGVVFHRSDTNEYVPGQAKNHGEARQVAERVIEHAENDGHLSLGVAAFSSAQRNAIDDELDRLRQHRRHLDDFFDPGRAEPFFVKNLENVQGDERDVIFISVGYGRRKDGRVLMNFGPVNRDGGERRLNVLVTRAKHRMEVFANFTADTIKTSANSSRGLTKFKEFLDYAENGTLELPVETGRAPDSEFEEQVAGVIRELGYEAVAQVGVSNYRIDVGVRSKSSPGRYMLGIECDGAMYHSARSARERDRLRQQVLEGMGWRIHRIWSTDWFRNSPAERREKLKTVLEEAQQTFDAERAAAAASSQQHQRESHRTEATSATDPVTLTDDVLDRERAVRPDPTVASDVEVDAPPRHEPDLRAPTSASSSNGNSSPGLGQHPPSSAAEFTPYRIADLGPFVDGRFSDAPGTGLHLSEALVRVAEVEAPIHLKVAAKKIADAMEIELTDQLIRECQAATQRSARLQLDGPFIFDLARNAVPARNRSSIPARDRNVEYVAPEEIRSAFALIVQENGHVSESELVALTLDALGFEHEPDNVKAVLAALKSKTNDR